MTPRRVLAMIMLAVLAWGVFHAVGAYTLNYNPWRFVVVLGCSLGFLGFWLLLLYGREQAGKRPDRRL